MGEEMLIGIVAIGFLLLVWIVFQIRGTYRKNNRDKGGKHDKGRKPT